MDRQRQRADTEEVIVKKWQRGRLMVDLPQQSDFFFTPTQTACRNLHPSTDGDGGEDEDKIKME